MEGFDGEKKDFEVHTLGKVLEDGTNVFVVGREGEEAGSRGVDILTSLTMKPEENGFTVVDPRW